MEFDEIKKTIIGGENFYSLNPETFAIKGIKDFGNNFYGKRTDSYIYWEW